jgi:ElaA protein
VFIKGQRVPEAEEVDGKDEMCRHYLAEIDGVPVATARVMDLGGVAKIQRVAVLDAYRGQGLGAELMGIILDDLRNSFASATLGSQTHAIAFYEKLGFAAKGPEFDDAGIPHREMHLNF